MKKGALGKRRMDYPNAIVNELKGKGKGKKKLN